LRFGKLIYAEQERPLRELNRRRSQKPEHKTALQRRRLGAT
jgi:hypothetical protein